MSLRHLHFSSLLLYDAFVCELLWLADTQQKVTGYAFGKEEGEPCITLKCGRDVLAQFYDQRVIMDLDTMRFKAKDVQGRLLTLAYSASKPATLEAADKGPS